MLAYSFAVKKQDLDSYWWSTLALVSRFLFSDRCFLFLYLRTVLSFLFGDLVICLLVLVDDPVGMIKKNPVVPLHVLYGCTAQPATGGVLSKTRSDIHFRYINPS